jgi:hypothetical protein
MREAFRTALKFLMNNLVIRDPRSPSRHPWKWCAFVLSDILIAKLPIPRPKSGVVVVLVNRLGDAIVGRSLMLALQSSVAKGQPFMVLGDRSWEVLKDNIYNDIATKYIDERRFRTDITYRIKTSLWLRFQNYHTAICFMHHRLEMRDDALVYVSAGQEKIVSELPFLNLRWYPWAFDFYLSKMTQIIPALPSLTPQSTPIDVYCEYKRKVPHAFERMQNFFNHLYPDANLEVKPIVIPTESQLFADQIVILNPGAKHEARTWPLSEWVSLAYQITNSGYTVFFTGGPAEAHLIGELHCLIEKGRASGTRKARIVVSINQLSFKSLIGLFNRAVCYIGPDTGTSHLAYWLGTPTITLLLHNDGTEEGDRFGDFFPYPEIFLPTPCRCVCATKAKFHMRDGSAGIRMQVYAAFNELIEAGSNV